MLTVKEIQELASRPERADRSVLTLYLNVDQSQQANLNRGFENQLKDLLVSIRNTTAIESELQRFETAARRVQDFVSRHHVAGQTLVVVCDEADGFFWAQPFNLPVPNRIGWGKEVIVQPLVAALDENERVGIALVDRANLRLFTMCLGEVQEHGQERFDHRKVRHTKTVGLDAPAAASHAQQKADEQIRLNLRQMVGRIESAMVRHGVHRLILAGSTEMTAQLRSVLPKRLQFQVIGVVDVALTATLEQIRKAASPVAEGFERQTEKTIVNNLVTSAAKAGRAITGITHTLQALNHDRVWQFVYAEECQAPGYECADCSALFSSEAAECAFCGSSVVVVPDVVSRAVDHAVRKGVKIEVVRGQEAQSLLVNAGGIGAFLRTRTASLRVS
jgi:peptide chain release factor subunit 1